MIPSVSGTIGPTPSADSKPAPAAVTSDYTTFLRMLTTQLQNQDPMNPMEGSDFAVQLATFSGVEQQAQTNKLLNALIGQLGGTGLSQYAEWIGKEVRTTDPVWFSDAPLTLDVTHDARADSVVLVTLDATGSEILREEIGPGQGQIDWYGKDASGDKLSDGRYSFRVEGYYAGQMISDTASGAYAKVIEAQASATGATLVLNGGVTVDATSVQAIRSGKPSV